MQVLGAIFAVLVGVSGLWFDAAPASAQGAADITGSLPPATAPSGPRTAVAPPSGVAKPAVTLRDSYAAISLAERYALQTDLVWSGSYNGPVNGEFSDQLVNAVKVFQRQIKARQTGVLNPQERAALSALVTPLQEQVGWKLVYDTTIGARIGLPRKIVPVAGAAKAGSLWSSAQGQVRIETFRIATPDTTLSGVFEQMKTEPVGRKIEHQALRPDSFTIIGMQGLKKLHVRGYARNNEVRGITILYDQAMDVTMDPLVTAITSSFLPFVSNVSTAPAAQGTAPRRMVEYGTGLVVSTAGHIVTDRQVVEGCQVVLVPQLGHAERLAEDKDNDLALLRVYGADDLVPLALLGEAAKGTDLTLVGIADPQSQGGNAAISTANTRLVGTTSTAGTTISLSQPPVLGFSGAAALDKSGRFFGMVGLKATVVAGTAPAAPKATIVHAETIKNFIEANYVAPSSGQTGVDNAKASVVRVVCVRK